jgi:B12-binding domain/radical SAM domain protein
VLVAMHARSGVVALNVVAAALGADLRTRDVEVCFVKRADELAAAIVAIAGRGGLPVVAWSFYSTDFPAASADLARVRESTAGCPALHIAGGVHATAEPLGTLRAGFDLAAIGEGEATAVAILTALLDGRAPLGIRGTASLDTSRGLVSHGPAERRPLDDFPAFDERHRKFNVIEITRGCVYACTFCQTPFMFKARFRHRSVENVREHVAALRRAGLVYVRFVTPTALSYGSPDETPDLRAVEALLAASREAFGPEGKIYFGTFPSEVRPEHVTEEALAVLARWVDNDNLVIGAQSGSARVLDATKRGHTVEDVRRAVRLAVRAGFRPNVDFLLGLPGETADDRRASLMHAEELITEGARIHSHAFMPLPGTPLRDATPEAIEPETSLAMARMEARGAMYGQWRNQVVLASHLTARRARA